MMTRGDDAAGTAAVTAGQPRPAPRQLGPFWLTSIGSSRLTFDSATRRRSRSIAVGVNRAGINGLPMAAGWQSGSAAGVGRRGTLGQVTDGPNRRDDSETDRRHDGRAEIDIRRTAAVAVAVAVKAAVVVAAGTARVPPGGRLRLLAPRHSEQLMEVVCCECKRLSYDIAAR